MSIQRQITERTFTNIYKNNVWLNLNNPMLKQTESKSGGGSTLEQTESIRSLIPYLLILFNIKTLLDAPCGDFNWMKEVNLGETKYIGVDIVKPMVLDNITKYGNSNKRFLYLDILSDTLPKADLILCRDCLVHFPVKQVIQAIKNFKKSGAKYLLTTTFINRNNVKLNNQLGDWSPYNLQKKPFNFPEPILILDEKCTIDNNKYSDKSLALWRLNDIKV